MNNEVTKVFSTYPDSIKPSMEALRGIILEVAKKDRIENLEECLKWGEPSYISKYGSTLRIDWKKRSPNQYFIYFNCKSRLVETFKTVYPSAFNYSDNRSIVFEVGQKIEVEKLKHCISMALNYHKIKHLLLLGA